MSEWTIDLETPAGTASDVAELEAFAAALEADATALGAAASMNTEQGTLSARFQVEAPNEQEAAMTACFAYWRALAAAGVHVEQDSRLTVAQAGDDEEGLPFTAPPAPHRAAA